MTETQTKTQAILALAEMFRRELSKAAVKMYVAALDDLTAEQVTKAATKAAIQCEFMPPPAKLRELAGIVGHADRAMLAFAAFERAVEGVGGYKSPDFDDPIINATVRHLGGWVRCCEMPCSEFDKFLRPQFIKTYESLSRSEVGVESCGRLIGEFERENARLGYSRPQDVIPVTTGLPWAGEHRRIAEKKADVPRVEFKRPNN